MDYASIPLDDDYRADVGAARFLGQRADLCNRGVRLFLPSRIVTPLSTWPGWRPAMVPACHVDACIGGFVLPFLGCLAGPSRPGTFALTG